jgi:hypothetical protein
MAYDARPTVLTTMSVLSGAGVRKMKYFKFTGYTFSPIYLAGLAEEIRWGYLDVKKTSYTHNYYSATENTIFLKFESAGTYEKEAMIVHEATHTMFDFQGKMMTVAESESLAYIAQCMYMQLNVSFDPNNPDDRLGDWEKKGTKWVETAKDGPYKKGWEIAKKIIGAGLTNSVYEVSYEDAELMKAAIKNSPTYSSTASNFTDFNGYL